MNDIDTEIIELEGRLSDLKWKRELALWEKYVGAFSSPVRRGVMARNQPRPTHVCCQSGAVIGEDTPGLAPLTIDDIVGDIHRVAMTLDRPFADKIWPQPNELFQHRPENVAPFPAETFPNIESNVDRLIANMDKYWGRPADCTLPEPSEPWPGYSEYHGV